MFDVIFAICEAPANYSRFKEQEKKQQTYE